MENKNKWIFLPIFITFLTSFFLWVIFSLQIDKSILPTLLKSNNVSVKTNNSDLDLTKFINTYNLIKSEYFDENTIDNEKLLESSISWLIDWLWDKHSVYFDSVENKQFNESLSWDFEGIWAVVEKHALWVHIDRIIKWSPAKKYDLRSWDILIKANWITLEWLNLIDAVNHIKWKAWTEVELEVLRVWENNIIIKNVIREKIKIPSVDTENITDEIGYISINMFWEDTSREFKNSLTKFENKDGIIIDLRDNWGGFLLSAVEILSELVENNEILVVTKYKDIKTNDIYKSSNNWNIYKWKIVVLINESSASASEITAWTLREYNKAIIVWKKSYWKWSVQKPFELNDWSMIKLTVAKWFTPNWINIDKEWITPDIEVWFIPEDFENKFDRQKEEAKEILLQYIDKKALKLTIDTYNNKTENE